MSVSRNKYGLSRLLMRRARNYGSRGRRTMWFRFVALLAAGCFYLGVTACGGQSAGTVAAPPAKTPSESATPAVAAATPSNAAKGSEVTPAERLVLKEYPVPVGSGPHDVAPAPDGAVWYTAQRTGELGRLDPATGKTQHVKLGAGSAPHGVIIGPDGAPWVTDGGLNAIVRVDPVTNEVRHYQLPGPRNANLNTATFDRQGILWFTGQNGIYGRLDLRVGEVKVNDAPRGRGPYGIATTPSGDVYYTSLAGNHLAHVDLDSKAAAVIEPPTRSQGARRVWSDSMGRLWVSEWNAGQSRRVRSVDGSVERMAAAGQQTDGLRGLRG